MMCGINNAVQKFKFAHISGYFFVFSIDLRFVAGNVLIGEVKNYEIRLTYFMLLVSVPLKTSQN